MSDNNVKIISVFNNKGGVGKTTLTFHLAWALSEIGKKVLLIDLDPQCNLTISGISTDEIHDIWAEEDDFIINFDRARNNITKDEFEILNKKIRTIHYILKPTEDGVGDLEELPPPKELSKNLHILPGRLTLHKYEDAISKRWSDVFTDEPLSIRTATKIRSVINEYANKYNYDIALVDTSPSLGIFNKVIISTLDGFIVPCFPDMFSSYGIRNIGDSLEKWRKEFDSIYHLISEESRSLFPASGIKFLGYTVYNAKKYTSRPKPKPWNLAVAHYHYAKKLIPETIDEFMPDSVCDLLDEKSLHTPIGEMCVMHTHNTFPAMAMKYRCPMWLVPAKVKDLGNDDERTVIASKKIYEEKGEKYREFAKYFLERINSIK